MSESRQLTVSCPGCDSRLVVDAATGEVLSHRKADQPLAGGADFETLFNEEHEGRAAASNVFDREVAAHEDRDRLLEEKFRQALEKVGDEPDDEPPPSPFDFD